MPDKSQVTWIIIHVEKGNAKSVWAYPEFLPDGSPGIQSVMDKAREIGRSPSFNEKTDEVRVYRLKGPFGEAEPHKFTKAMTDEWPVPEGENDDD